MRYKKFFGYKKTWSYSFKLESKKSKTIALSIIVIVFAIIIVAGLNWELKHIEDTNGVDTSLVTFSIPEDISNPPKFSGEGVTYVCNTWLSRSSTLKSSSSGIYKEPLDYCTDFTFSIDKTSGIILLDQFTKIGGDPFTITYSLEVISGNLEMYLIGSDNNVIIDLNHGDDIEVILSIVPDGTYKIYIGAESAAFTLDYKID